MKKNLLLLLLLLSSVPILSEKVSPLQVSIISGMQLVSESTTIIGYRLNIFHGSNDKVYGLDTGLFNESNESGGISLGAASYTREFIGVQAGIANIARYQMYGFQIGVFNYSNKPYGVQAGIVNVSNDAYIPMFGVLANWGIDSYLGQFSVGFNQSRKTPFQISGVLNNSRESTFQLSLINFADYAGLQISGLWNYTEEKGTQFSSGVNISDSSYFQFAGIYNYSQKTPVQLALLGNLVDNGVVQFAGVFNYSKNSVAQIFGLVNGTENSFLQVAGLLNVRKCLLDCRPNHQVSLVGNYANQTDTQFGILNLSDKTRQQIGLFNFSDTIEKVQVGLVNRSLKTTGSMFGLINESHDLTGFQVGLINIAKNAKFPFMPFYNSNYEKRDAKFFSGFVNNTWTFFQMGLYSPIQIFSYDTEVSGLRLNIFYGKNISVSGIDIGLLNYSEGGNGFGVGIANLVDGQYKGIQIGALNKSQNFYGIQLGLLGQYNQKDFYGLGISGLNFTIGNVYGAQLGLFGNHGDVVHLSQISLGINFASSNPVQISGLGNYTKTDSNIQVSTGFNFVGQSAWIQLAGLFNYAEGTVKYGQISGFFNRANFTPWQLSLIGNHAVEESYFQFAGIFNMVTKNIRSAPFSRGLDPYLQIALFFNLSGHTYLQVSAFNIDDTINYSQVGLVNFAKKGFFQTGGVNINLDMRGAQFGGINVSDEIFGVQLGLVNLAERTTGLDIGIWNIYREQKGVSIGLFNYAKNLKGMQIGLINIHANGSIPLMIGVNF